MYYAPVSIFLWNLAHYRYSNNNNSISSNQRCGERKFVFRRFLVKTQNFDHFLGKRGNATETSRRSERKRRKEAGNK
jgi:hypothetical protein